MKRQITDSISENLTDSDLESVISSFDRNEMDLVELIFKRYESSEIHNLFKLNKFMRIFIYPKNIFFLIQQMLFNSNKSFV